jgi:hypothetical protein
MKWERDKDMNILLCFIRLYIYTTCLPTLLLAKYVHLSIWVNSSTSYLLTFCPIVYHFFLLHQLSKK